MHPFKNARFRQVIWLSFLAGFILLLTASCRVKYGCPSNGKNVGAERLMSGEKLPKVQKFRS